MMDARIDPSIEPRRCLGITKAGEPCKQTMAILPSGFCGEHDPDLIAQREAMRNGNEPPPPPRTVEDAVNYSSWLAWAVSTDKISAVRAQAANQSLKTFVKAIDVRQLKRRIRELEKMVKKAKALGALIDE